MRVKLLFADVTVVTYNCILLLSVTCNVGSSNNSCNCGNSSTNKCNSSSDSIYITCSGSNCAHSSCTNIHMLCLLGCVSVDGAFVFLKVYSLEPLFAWCTPVVV